MRLEEEVRVVLFSSVGEKTLKILGKTFEKFQLLEVCSVVK